MFGSRCLSILPAMCLPVCDATVPATSHPPAGKKHILAATRTYLDWKIHVCHSKVSKSKNPYSMLQDAAGVECWPPPSKPWHYPAPALWHLSTCSHRACTCMQGKKFHALVGLMHQLHGANETGWLLWMEPRSMIANPRYHY
jgi:hypothetical protein